MEKINLKRVILGGLLAGVVFIIVEMFLEGIIHLIFKLNERDLLLQAFNDATISGARYHIVNLSHFFVLCIFFIWVYAVIRPRFGAGPKTAIIVSVMFWLILLLMYVNQVNMNIFPLKLALVSLAFNLIELPVAILAGTSIYKEV